MSDLQQFVNEQRAKSSLFAPIATSSLPSLTSIRTKLTSGFSAFPSLVSTSSIDSDREALTSDGDLKESGQLPQARNRKNGWFSSDESFFGYMFFSPYVCNRLVQFSDIEYFILNTEYPLLYWHLLNLDTLQYVFWKSGDVSTALSFKFFADYHSCI